MAYCLGSDYCLMYLPARISASNGVTKNFSIYNFVCICVFSVYTLQPDLCSDPNEENITNVSRFWMALWNSVIFLTRDAFIHLKLANVQLFPDLP